MRRRKAIGRLLLLLLTGLFGVLAWLTYRQARQERLNLALIVAIQRGDVASGLAALKAGADPNSRNKETRPLSVWQWLRRLCARLSSKSKPAPSSLQPTALMLAFDNEFSGPFLNTTPLIRALVAAGAEVNVKDSNGWTPLRAACQLGDSQTAGILLAKGARINVKDDEGTTPLTVACEHDDYFMVGLLLAQGAEVNARDKAGKTPLMAAIDFQSHLDIVKTLLAWGAEVNIKDASGDTLLTLALATGRNDIVSVLLSKGIAVNMRADGISLWWWAIEENRPDFVKRLLSSGIPVTTQDSDGYTSLKRAATLGYRQIVHLLKQAGAKE